MKYSFIQKLWNFIKCTHVFQQIHPLVCIREQVTLLFYKIRQFKEFKTQFIVKNCSRRLFHQGNIMEVTVLLTSFHAEVQNADQVNFFQVVTMGAPPLFQLPLDKPGGVIQRPVLEEILPGTLHLNNEILAVITTAMQIEDNSFVLFLVTVILIGCVFEVHDMLLPLKKVVEKSYYNLLVGFLPEKMAEAPIRKRVDESTYFRFLCTGHIQR